MSRKCARIVVCAALAAQAASAATWTVYHEEHVPVKDGVVVTGASALTPVAQLTNALAQASRDDRIVIKPGVYDLDAELGVIDKGDGHGLSYLIIDNKSLVLEGEDPAHWSEKAPEQETVIRGGAKGRIVYAYMGGGRSSVFRHLTFEGGTAGEKQQGGAIYFLDALSVKPHQQGYASNCVFRANTASESGATHYVTAYDSLFTNNVATLNGGGASGIVSRNSTTGAQGTNDFIACVFVDNRAERNGGALYINYTKGGADMGACDLSGCRFEGNRARRGGALLLTATAKSDAHLAACHFSNNVATENGGAVAVEGEAMALLADTAFAGNAAAKGGGVWTEGRLETMTNCTFAGNTATGDGASMQAEGGYGQIAGCVFRDNVAAGTGAGVAAPSLAHAGEVHACRFDNNTNKWANVGSQIRFARRVTDCTFAGAGDMIAAAYDRCVFEGCRFDYENYGGAMILFNEETGAGSLRNCLFRNNTLHNGIQNSTGASIEIANCTFASNEVIKAWNPFAQSWADGYLFFAFRGGEGDVKRPSTNVIVNCLFADNWRDGKRADVSFYRTTTNVGSSYAGNILSNALYEVADLPAQGLVHGANVVAAPKFLAGDPAYPGKPHDMPSRASPARNAGRRLAWMTAEATDLAGGPRVVDDLPDIGCYECDLPPRGTLFLVR